MRFPELRILLFEDSASISLRSVSVSFAIQAAPKPGGSFGSLEIDVPEH
jgi:hypothetical protein